MHYRRLGRTGLRVSEISLGCNRIGDPGTILEDWYPLVRRALDLGVNFFDTSNSYNQGRSEEVLGVVAAREPVYFATKVGVPVMTNDYANREFSAATILREVEHSLRRLRRDSIDVYQLHSPTVQQLEQNDWAEALLKLKEQGKVRWLGISTSDEASGIWCIRHGLFDVLQINYNLLDLEAEQDLLPLAMQHDIGITVRTPLARGLLTGKFPPGQELPAEQQWRRPRGAELQQRLARVEQFRFLERPGRTLGQAALQFVLSHPGVSCAIPGARTIAQLEENVAASNGRGLDPQELAQVHEIQAGWNR
jgi:myo-inositol catabolism protein IolS